MLCGRARGCGESSSGGSRLRLGTRKGWVRLAHGGLTRGGGRVSAGDDGFVAAREAKR